MKNRFQPGDRATYRGDFGTAPPVPCTITDVDDDGGRAQLVYGCLLGKGEFREKWGYARQFEHLREG